MCVMSNICEQMAVFLIIIVVGSLFYIFCWWMPKKIANSKEGELEDWPDIKRRIKNKIIRYIERW